MQGLHQQRARARLDTRHREGEGEREDDEREERQRVHALRKGVGRKEAQEAQKRAVSIQPSAFSRRFYPKIVLSENLIV